MFLRKLITSRTTLGQSTEAYDPPFHRREIPRSQSVTKHEDLGYKEVDLKQQKYLNSLQLRNEKQKCMN
jgi:hypothetical protein